MPEEPELEQERLSLQQARDLTQCFGHHRSQTLEYALHYCLHCRKLKSCVRTGWGWNRTRRGSKDDWWPLTEPVKPPASPTQPRGGRKAVNIS